MPTRVDSSPDRPPFPPGRYEVTARNAEKDGVFRAEEGELFQVVSSSRHRVLLHWGPTIRVRKIIPLDFDRSHLEIALSLGMMRRVLDASVEKDAARLSDAVSAVPDLSQQIFEAADAVDVERLRAIAHSLRSNPAQSVKQPKVDKRPYWRRPPKSGSLSTARSPTSEDVRRAAVTLLASIDAAYGAA